MTNWKLFYFSFFFSFIHCFKNDSVDEEIDDDPLLGTDIEGSGDQIEGSGDIDINPDLDSHPGTVTEDEINKENGNSNNPGKTTDQTNKDDKNNYSGGNKSPNENESNTKSPKANVVTPTGIALTVKSNYILSLITLSVISLLTVYINNDHSFSSCAIWPFHFK